MGNLEIPYRLGPNDLWIRSHFVFFFVFFRISKGPTLGPNDISRISRFLNFFKLKTLGKCTTGASGVRAPPGNEQSEWNVCKGLHKVSPPPTKDVELIF